MKYLKHLMLLICSVIILGYLTSCEMFGKKQSNVDLSCIPVYNGEKYLYIDKLGKIMINPQFTAACAFRDDKALVRNEDEKYGYIDKTGNYVINPIYKFACNFSEGLAVVVKPGEAPSVIDTKGNQVFNLPKADNLFSFDNGLAIFSEEVDGNNLFGFVNEKGEIVLPAQFIDVRSSSDGLCSVKTKDEKWGFVNGSGKMEINPQFPRVGDFHEGLCYVGDKNGKFGFIDKKGNIKINYQFSDVFDFSNGMAVVESGGKYGAINKNGQFVINPQFERMISDGDMFIIIDKDNQIGWCNSKGEVVINPQFDGLACGFGKRDCAAICNSDREIGFIDKNGKYIINPQFDGISPYSIDNWAFFETGDGVGIMDKLGKYIVNPQYEAISGDFLESLKKESGAFVSLNRNVERGCNVYNFVQSDYLDPAPIVEFTRNTFFVDYPITTSYGQIKSKTGFNDSKFNYERLMIFDKNIVKGVDASLIAEGEPHYTTTETHREYYYGGYYYQDHRTVVDHYRWDMSPDELSLLFYLSGKAEDKRDMVISELVSMFKANGYNDPSSTEEKEIASHPYVLGFSDATFLFSEGNVIGIGIGMGSDVGVKIASMERLNDESLNMEMDEYDPSWIDESPNYQSNNTSYSTKYVVIDGSELRLRLGPSTSADTFKWSDGTNRHPNVGEKFKYLGESGDFYKIDFKGNNVWVSKLFTHIE